jgi:hypothetical protein
MRFRPVGAKTPEIAFRIAAGEIAAAVLIWDNHDIPWRRWGSCLARASPRRALLALAGFDKPITR